MQWPDTAVQGTGTVATAAPVSDPSSAIVIQGPMPGAQQDITKYAGANKHYDVDNYGCNWLLDASCSRWQADCGWARPIAPACHRSTLACHSGSRYVRWDTVCHFACVTGSDPVQAMSASTHACTRWTLAGWKMQISAQQHIHSVATAQPVVGH
jgi:hypothetical protein